MRVSSDAKASLNDIAQLAALQRQFAQTLWHPHASTVPATFGRGMGVYQNNTRLTLLSAVETTYPVVARVLGEDFFSSLARSYVITTSSSSGNLQSYAQQFSAWLTHWLGALEDRNEATELAYLPDLARLEWLVHQAHFATDAPPFDFNALMAVNPASQGALCFKLHPSCALLHSEFPVAQIWRAHQRLKVAATANTANAAAENIKAVINWDGVPEQLLLWRQSITQFEIAVKIQDCDAATFQFLMDLSVGTAFDVATSNALSVDAALDLQALLLENVSAGVICGFAFSAACLAGEALSAR